MAQYLILIYGNEQRWDDMSDEELRSLDEGHAAFRQAAGSRILASGELDSSRTATTLRAGDTADSRPSITDGPFLESKEVVGGFYLIGAGDLDEAMALSSALPELRQDHTGVQVHPLVDHG